MKVSQVQIEEGWHHVLEDEFQKEYFTDIKRALLATKKAGHKVYPPGPLIFNAFNLTPWSEVKVVILGQDPYHNPGEAMGLSFSVPRGVRIPPSLMNIYKELKTDLDIPIARHGDLTAWAEQGVLLLNAMLTVEHKKAGSHQKIGWQRFTNAIIEKLSTQKEGLVFMLWGRFAQSKSALIDASRHLVLEAAHPSPLARGAYFGSQHFSKANQFLTDHSIDPIDWNLS
ncbi:MAG: uracil-DNA glycosylase [Bacteroidota bacterium]